MATTTIQRATTTAGSKMATTTAGSKMTTTTAGSKMTTTTNLASPLAFSGPTQMPFFSLFDYKVVQSSMEPPATFDEAKKMVGTMTFTPKTSKPPETYVLNGIKFVMNASRPKPISYSFNMSKGADTICVATSKTNVLKYSVYNLIMATSALGIGNGSSTIPVMSLMVTYADGSTSIVTEAMAPGQFGGSAQQGGDGEAELKKQASYTFSLAQKFSPQLKTQRGGRRKSRKSRR